ncbi:SGNH/GDSL hydrolase family protein [Paeniglutamicibacter cryotolerans]|uniref:Lysophospholipase L1-like esterase n=1 Tax=Paeniglutamicibacter cryotolerans TaxID=670079 RepID=A0A839QDA2_9MICC|nr:SGNH/GDSL hydrolase family protein [Paeniglutamicibacter cryotolerans]MBB2994148.1 lysophospholipase L1-like esterase [Paeniglutamicibacter cryotolerans]
MTTFPTTEMMRNGWLDAVQAAPAYFQGRHVKKVVPLLGEAAGPKRGVADAAGTGGVPLRLLVIGESTVAGTGAPTHDVALTGQLAMGLSTRRSRPVAWEAEGSNGATMERIRREVLGLIQEHDPDIVFLAAGANDAMIGRLPGHWGRDLRLVIDVFIEPVRSREIVVAGVPPFRNFPALPVPLNEFLERRARRLDAVSARICAELGIGFVGFAGDPPLGDDFYASDHFHPSVAGYGHWASFLLDELERDRH